MNDGKGKVPWSKPFGRRCPARCVGYGGIPRCDLARGHGGDHRAERGMFDVLWSAKTWTEGH